MNKETFKLIMDSLVERTARCEKAFSKVTSTEDLLKLQLSEVIELRDFCRSEVSDMTKIAMVDFYHIVGMGNLTPPQMTKFTFAMRNYLNYRSDIKNIASNLDSISKLPKLPTKSKFKLLALCDLTLTKNVRPEEEDEVEVEDLETVNTYGEISKVHTTSDIATLYFKLKDSIITVEKDKLADFFKQIAPATAHYNTFKDKVVKGKPAFGISWVEAKSSDSVYTGLVAKETREALIQKFNL